MPKSVCIVGAGPAGLVVAKYLLREKTASGASRFRVTIYDAQPRVGGLWPLRQDDLGGQLHPLMVANQSRHTVQFADLAWEADAPQFPRAWQVGRYLERYCRTHCSAAEFRLGSRVELAEPLQGSTRGWCVAGSLGDVVDEAGNGGGPESASGWKVRAVTTTTTPDGGVEEVRKFDFLVVASGYFGQAHVPWEGVFRGHGVPVVTSAKYRDLETLLGKGDTGSRDKILVVGGQMSGVEVAATIASHLSSAVHSPGASPIKDPKKYSVEHVGARPCWVFPLFTTPDSDNAAPRFWPVDMGSYNLAGRPRPFENQQGVITVEQAVMTHSRFEQALGGDQAQFGKDVSVAGWGGGYQDPAYLAMSDTYMEYVRAGRIVPVRGKLEGLAGSASVMGNVPMLIDGLAAVVLATGWEPAKSLSFLPPAVLEELKLDVNDQDNAVVLSDHGTLCDTVANLGFVGFYRSPYWGVMEMQARFLAKLFSAVPVSGTKDGGGGVVPLDKIELLRTSMPNVEDDDCAAKTLQIRANPARASQFPMGDYAYLMDRLGTFLDVPIQPHLQKSVLFPQPSHVPLDFLSPARYVCAATDAAEAMTSMQQAQSVADTALNEGRFVARAVFRSLQGRWSVERDIDSKAPNYPSGHFSGDAWFHPRAPTVVLPRSKDTNDNSDDGMDVLEYLYVEKGRFMPSTPGAISFTASRSYVWRYDGKTDKLSVWFVKPDDRKSVDYLFHEVDFIVPKKFDPLSSTSDHHNQQGDEQKAKTRTSEEDEGEKKKGWCATAGHMCLEDFYDVAYEFLFRAVNIERWTLRYKVSGPKKDYVLSATYTRPEKGDSVRDAA